MKTGELTTNISPELRAELQQAIELLAKGIRDPQAAKKASERMDQMREENRQLFGEQNSAVSIIREMRESR